MSPLEQLEELKKELDAICPRGSADRGVAGIEALAMNERRSQIELMISRAFDLGRREQARIDREAIAPMTMCDYYECRDEALALLASVAPDEGKE